MKKVLVVDDESLVSTFVKSALETETGKYKVFSADNPLEGLKVLDSVPVDCVITDYSMPDMDGLEFTREIRRIYGNTLPVIGISGYIEDDMSRDFWMNDLDAFLQKPLGLDSLLHTLEIVFTETQSLKQNA